MRIDYTRPKLYAKQAAFVDCEARYTIVEAATKVGKTVCCLVWLLEKALEGKSGQNFWWVAPIYPQSSIAFSRLKRWLAESTLPRELWKAREDEQSIGFANGAKIWFKGADKPDGLYGEDVYAVVMDEATRCKADAWYAVRSTLTATGGPIKIIGNVRGRKNWAYQMARRAEAGEPGHGYFKLTAYDAIDGGILTLAEVEDAKRVLPPHVFGELYLAEPADDGGNPFGLTAIAACVSPQSKRDPIAFGVDLAKSVDYTVPCGLDEDGAVCSLDRWQSDWQQTRRRLVEIIGEVPALIDSTGVGDPIVEDLMRECTYARGFKFSKSSKQQLMEGLAAAIQQRQIKFPDGWLRAELENFEYQYTPSGVRYSAPDGLHDDGVMGLALAWKQLKDSNKYAMEMTDETPCVIS